ncbi:AraC family transcriptional regulator [Chondromyces crocatus]|uniref:AraC family transcriptional regulator n=1 Tax=Chondromyces crocatus TaxID=52 RepID=A0A0K1EJM0_CHOCO|nr:AraC family transcriptional regulator [Chondromyces crocatus]AKT40793.1 AraC family transcriptional regulator [Chondromyces crocatus]
MLQDPLSEVLALMRAQTVVSGGLVAGGRWAVRFPPPQKLKFFVLMRGTCWLTLEGQKAPSLLAEGDVLLLLAQRPFVIGSALDVPPVDAELLFADPGLRVGRVGEGEMFSLLGGHVALDPTSGRLLLDELPPRIHIRAASDEARPLRWLIDRLVQEHRGGSAGSEFAATQIAQLMFLHALRVYLSGLGEPGNAGGEQGAGRLRALSDPRLAPALRLMHGEPARAWHLDELARASAMSRTSFALHFKAVAGVAPLAYLTEWRMRLAERALRDSDAPVARVAESLGYASESSFSTAFKRVTGSAPQRYRSAARQRAPSP